LGEKTKGRKFEIPVENTKSEGRKEEARHLKAVEGEFGKKELEEN